MSDEVTEVKTEELEAMQKANLSWLEKWGRQFIVSNVPVGLAFNYELIQIFNRLALQERLKGEHADE